MSYEGYDQCICANGHYYERDCYFEDQPCSCGANAAWQNGVDCTNCDSYGIIPHEIFSEKFRISEAEYQTCNMGHSHLIKPEVFRIPTRKESDPLRHYRDIRTDKLKLCF